MKYFYLIFLILTIIPSVIAVEESLGVFKQASCVNLKQTCANCTFVNVTSVVGPDSIQILGNRLMTKTGTEYNYTFCNTTKLGEYTYITLGNPDGTNTVAPVTFIITPSGFAGVLGLYIIIITIVYLVSFFGFFGKNVWVAVFGGLGMILLGLYMLNNGIDIYRNFMTESLSFITIGLGATFALTATLELINDQI